MPRKLRVATTSFGRRTAADVNVELACRLLEAAGASGADVAVLPEALNVAGVSRERYAYLVEPGIPGPASERLAAIARKYQMYVVAGLYNLREGKPRNTAVILDRNGQEAWRYEKIYPTMGEVDWGITPGARRSAVVDLDFGRAGVAICYDIGWPAHWDHLAADGAEIVFWPSAYDGGFPLRAYAWRHRYYVVSSVRTFHSKVIDITGEVMGQTSRYSSLFVQDLDLEKEVFHSDTNEYKILEMQARYGHRVSVRALSEEAVITVESNDPQLSVVDLKREFGLESFADFHARAEAIQDRARLSDHAGVPA